MAYDNAPSKVKESVPNTAFEASQQSGVYYCAQPDYDPKEMEMKNWELQEITTDYNRREGPQRLLSDRIKT